jgi:PAS domain S-box-containing protein
MSDNLSFNKAVKTTLIWIIALSMLVHIASLYLSKTLLIDWRWSHLPFHSAVEVAGSFIAILVALLLVAMERKGSGTSFNIPIAGALMGMGVLDGLHAVVHPGQTFVFLHSVATFIGGCLFVFTWRPAHTLSSWGFKWPLLVGVASFVLGLFAIYVPEWLPKMVVEGQFTTAASALNFCGGVLLLLSAVRLFTQYRHTKRTDDLLFVLHCAMFGFAAILFQESKLWDASWWGWHLLRFFAYGVALWFALTSDLMAQAQTIEQKTTLKKTVDEQSDILANNQKAMQFIESRQKAIVSSLKDALIITDEQGMIHFSNPAMSSLFGYSRGQVLETPVQNLLPKISFTLETASRSKSAETQSTQELIARRQDKEEFPAEISCTTLYTDNKTLFILVVRDISERYKFEESLKQAIDDAQESNRHKSVFLANMSHEIRTPMNGILGTLQLLGVEDQTPKSKNLVNKALISCKRLLTIINDILDFSKIEAGQLSIEETELDIHQVIENIFSDMSVDAQEKGIDLNIHIDTNTSQYWIGDPIRVGQILLNIVANAIKFTKVGSVKLHVSQIKQQDRDALEIVISDTGIGMNKEAINHLFDRFQQADDSTTRNFGGTGLGMSISKQLIEMMGGEIHIKSKINVGSNFTITLPLENPRNGESLENEKENIKQPNLKGYKILIAEDNEINQFILMSLIETTHAELILAGNGKEAVDAFKIHKPNIILMDIQMPVMDGLEASKHILNIDPNAIIIACTANVFTEDVEHYKRQGIKDCIAKPIESNILYKVLNQFI